MSTPGESKENEFMDGYGTPDDLQLIPGKSLMHRDVLESSYDRGNLSPLGIEMNEKQKIQIGGLKVIIISTVAFSLCVTLALIVTIYHDYGQKLKHVSVASSVHECSKAGVRLMEKGGSAIDAAVASTLCVCVMNPLSASLGSGGFLLIRDSRKNKSEVFDFMSTAPNDSTPDMFMKFSNDIPPSGLSVAVPGLLHGLSEVHKRYGKLTWRDVVIPAAVIAINGFNISDTFSALVRYELDNADKANHENLKNYFKMPNGNIVTTGDLFVQPSLGKLLKVIAENGIEDFYNGRYAEEIVKTVQNYNGILKKSDLSNYKCLIKTPIETDFRQSIIQSAPLPASGDVILSAINALNRYNWSSDSMSNNESYHHLLDALALSLQITRDMEDDPNFFLRNNSFSDFGKIPLHELHSAFQNGTSNVSKPFSSSIRSKSLSLSQISVYDYDDVMVSVSISLGDMFGSKIITNSGILLNNLMNLFHTNLSESSNIRYNDIEPNKRPVAPMAPTLVFSRKNPCSQRVALGTSGNSDGLFSIVQVILRAIGFQKSLKESILSPNFFLMNENTFSYSGEVEPSLLNYLIEKGHILKQVDKSPTNINAAAKINETVQGFSDFMHDNEVFVQ